MKKIILSSAIIIVIALAGLAGVFYWQNLRGAWSVFGGKEQNMSSKEDLIRVGSPRPDQVVLSPLVIGGEARGYWFFEASFPVRVLDGDGTELGIGVAQAQRDPATGEVNWMTENFVTFRATIDFRTPRFATGTLVLEKDNPSGLLEHADELRLPIAFKEFASGARGPCYIGGCSSQVCSDEEGVITTCEFRPEYSCYKAAKCERQADGRCGWTKTPEFESCLSKAKEAE